MTRLGRSTVALLAVLLLSSCTEDGRSSARQFKDPGVPVGSLKLVAFDSCADLLAGLRTAAKASVGPFGFGGQRYALDDRGGTKAMEDGGGPARVAAPETAGNTYSTTNTHEAGVDEPDLVKTDGKRIVTVAGGVLRVVDAASRAVTGTLDIATDGTARKVYGMTDLLLAGDHALVLGQQYGVNPDETIYGPNLTLVDLKGQPKVLGKYSIEGALVDARQVGSTARVVVRSAPRVRFPAPVDRGNDVARVEANRRVIDDTPVEAWLPRYSIVDGSGKKTDGHVECSSVSRPAQYSGAATLTVLSFDLGASSLGSGEPVTLVADGDNVYANGPSMYIANDQRWQVMWRWERTNVQPPKPQTQLYKFDISGTGKPRFLAAGEVDGWLLNQYSMSEWDGRLRVATTLGQPWDRSGSTESTVYVLGVEGRELTLQGKVGGLGKGERIYAVRFIGTTGYVVTFRQTDPLYTIDLRDPKSPKVLGALKINGYSAYLHPAGDGRLIGIGQDANDQGRVQGTQVSLFDVRDLANPTRVGQFKVSNSHSEAEFDPHAFLYWEPTGLLVVPLYTYQNDRQKQGALVLSVRDSTITEAGLVSHPNTRNGRQQIRRSLIINQTLWTVSDSGLKANDMTTLSETAWLPFP
jgi:uncharacterized secreted protein with C-terminal beta-propeller domain